MREYLRWLWPHRYALASLFVLALAGAGLQMTQPLFVRYIVDNVLFDDSPNGRERFTVLNVAAAAYLGVVALEAALGVMRDYKQRLLVVRVTLTLRRRLFERMLRLPLAKLSEMKTGGILSRLTGDINSAAGLLQLALIAPGISVVRLLIAVGILLALNWQLTLVTLMVIPGALLFSFIFAQRIRPIYRIVREDISRIDGRVGETFAGIRVVRAFRREAREALDYMRGQHGVVRKELFAHRRELMFWTSWGFLSAGISVVILWYGGYMYLIGRASVGDIMAFQWYSLLLLNPVWQVVNSFSESPRSLAALERVFDVLAAPNDKPDLPDAIDAPAVVRHIEFDRVGFEYRKGNPVIHAFNVVVPAGSVVALVGRSGAGKTTATDLIARFHDPTRGRILLNGMDIRRFRLRTYRNLFSIVPQTLFLFDGSVRDNIAYGNHLKTDAEVENAARRANAHEFIIRLPDGYETFVGERGVKLSGGQQQRLAIARAILADPQILILDEATSNLDTENEHLIQESIAMLLAGRTTFVIAHRLSTVRRADLILLLEDGQIAERGRHEELMEARGKYYKMVMRQMAA